MNSFFISKLNVLDTKFIVFKCRKICLDTSFKILAFEELVVASI